MFTMPNAYERAIVKALTKAIIARRVKIEGTFDCVNSLCTGSNSKARSISVAVASTLWEEGDGC